MLPVLYLHYTSLVTERPQFVRVCHAYLVQGRQVTGEVSSRVLCSVWKLRNVLQWKKTNRFRMLSTQEDKLQLCWHNCFIPPPSTAMLSFPSGVSSLLFYYKFCISSASVCFMSVLQFLLLLEEFFLRHLVLLHCHWADQKAAAYRDFPWISWNHPSGVFFHLNERIAATKTQQNLLTMK